MLDGEFDRGNSSVSENLGGALERIFVGDATAAPLLQRLDVGSGRLSGPQTHHPIKGLVQERIGL